MCVAVFTGYVLMFVQKTGIKYRYSALSFSFFFFQAEDGIRDLVRSRGLGDVYKRQSQHSLYEWRKKFAASNAKGNDEAEEIRRLKKELALSLIHI